MLRSAFVILSISISSICFAQIKWQNVDSIYQPLPKSVQIFFTDQPVDSSPFRAFYLIADIKDQKLNFTTDTSYKRRLTPAEFYKKNALPLAVVNGTFFSFETNANLNVVIKNGKVLAHNAKTMRSEGDTNKIVRIYNGAIGIAKNRTADIAWVRTDSNRSFAQAIQFPFTNKGNFITKNRNTGKTQEVNYDPFQRWKVQTAIGGGPVLLQNGKIKITNNEERMFAGKAINDKHPRTAMGYTKDNKLIILVVEGRNAAAAGATLTQEAQILKDLDCVEGLNLDGGGSSCLLINGKETIVPSDKKQRAVPAVFIIKWDKD
jgi:exopolysaccharide biosynthesis protein